MILNWERLIQFLNKGRQIIISLPLVLLLMFLKDA